MARLAIDEPNDADTDRQRRTLKERRKRLHDHYETGEYRAKCAEIDEAPDGMAPGPTADLDGFRAVLEDFGRFWESEADPVSAASWPASSSSACGSTSPASSPYRRRKRSRRSSSDTPAGAAIGPQMTTPPLEGAARLKVRERRDSNPRPPA
jgi:hypothetical protein